MASDREEDGGDGYTLAERLAQLEHDLGKYLRLPFGLLPGDAADEEVREALEEALLQTRRGPDGVTGAAELFERFAESLPPGERESDRFAQLAAAVETALAWSRALAPDAPCPRPAIERDLKAVGAAIRAYLEEVS